jgi:hypothetical protein
LEESFGSGEKRKNLPDKNKEEYKLSLSTDLD